METQDLVAAALLGLDKGEVVTIPPLADEALWTAYEAARLALAPHLSRREVAGRASHTTPSARPASAKASMARSTSASVSAADIWVRILARPFGTTGKKKPAT